MFNIILVASGGAVGALLRFAVGNLMKTYLNNSFYSTFCINIIGSFLIGYLISMGFIKNMSESFIKYFLIVGLLGSFTTFSTFSYEAIELYLSNKFFLFMLYVILSVVLCIFAAYFGMYINKN